MNHDNHCAEHMAFNCAHPIHEVRELRKKNRELEANNVDNVRRMADDANKLHAAYTRVARLESALDRHGAFRDAAVTLVRDMRLALLRGDYLIKQQMDARSDAWLKEVDGPRPTRSPSRPDNLSTGSPLSDATFDRKGEHE